MPTKFPILSLVAPFHRQPFPSLPARISSIKFIRTKKQICLRISVPLDNSQTVVYKRRKKKKKSSGNF
jgi:hypothetical protein